MTTIENFSQIEGVQIARLKAFGDSRGRFRETFRKEWFPQRSWDIFQTNRSDSIQGVLRGLHYHFKQVDYWCVMHGTLRAAMVDIRPDSPTFRQTATIDMGDDNMIGLLIPVGVAHGFSTLSKEVTLTYIVDNYYDNSDEYGIAWNDPELAIDWGVANPTLSDRDAQNRPLSEIPLDQLPRLNAS